jgi:outer membrane protein insertion porin family
VVERLGWAAAVLVILAFVAKAQDVPGTKLFEGQPVVAVILVTRPNLDAEEFRHLVTQQSGESYSSAKISESIAALKATGQFTDVRSNVIPQKGGLRLEFFMDPVFSIGIFEFPEAARTFSYAQLLGEVRYPTGEPYQKDRVEEAVPTLKQFFAGNGYFASEVHVETQLDEAHQLVNVTYRVDLGKKARFGKIEINGPTPESTAQLQNALHSFRALLRGAKLKTGKPYDPNRVRAAYRLLRDYLGKQNYLSSQVRVRRTQYDPRTNRADLTFDVTLGPTVIVRATGAHVSSKTLHNQVPIYQENAVDQDLVDLGSRNLASYFQGKGYFDASIASHMETADNKTTVTYQIDPGNKHRVASISVSGNHEFDEDQVEKLILLKKAHWLSRGKFSADLLKKSRSNLEALWKNAGYSDAQITPRIEDRDSKLYVTFEISPGRRTMVDSFQAQGNQNLQIAQFLNTGLEIKPGQPYSPFRAMQDRNRIIAAYLNAGYLNATMRIDAVPVSEDLHRIAVTYVIDEGPHVRVSDAIYLGQHQSQVSMLRRETDIQPEADLSEKKLLQGESDLYNLGVFDWANVSPRKPIIGQTSEDVLVRVHEAKRNSISYGVGFESTPRTGSFSTGTLILPGLPSVGLPANFKIIEKTIISPLGSISYSRLNMRGRAETISVSALLSTLDQKGTVTYSFPHFAGTNWSSLITGFGERTTQNPLFAARLGQGSFQLERNLDAARTRKLQLHYAFQHTALDHLLIQNFVPPQDLSTNLSTISATFLRDTRDQPLDAHKGFYQTLDFQFSPKAFGSTDNVARFFGQTAYYWQATPWFVFANNIRLGLISSFAGSHVPFSQRFFSGGADSLRGFPLNGAGPQSTALLCTAENDPATCTAKVAVPAGGKALFIFNSEGRFPVPIKKGLGGVIFYDGGNVYSSINLREMVRNYSNSVGIGLRYNTPVGPLRIDFGHDLNPVPGFKSIQIFVTLGQSF